MTRPIGFSLGTWMALGAVTVCVVLLAYVADERTRGSNVLAIGIHRLNLGEEYDDQSLDIYPLEAWKDDASLWDIVSSNEFEVPERVKISEAKIDAETASQFNRSKAWESIGRVDVRDSEIDEDAAFFLASWKDLKSIACHDTRLPKMWRDGLVRDTEDVAAMFLVGKNGLEIEDYLKLGHLKLLWIRDGDLDQAAVDKLENELPNTRVIIMPEDPETISLTGPPLSQRNAVEVKKMRDAFSRLQTAAASAGLGESDYQVSDFGWNEEQIVAFERSLGISMHKSVRAFLEVQAGRWLRHTDPLFWDWSEKQWRPQELISRNKCEYQIISFERDMYDEEEPSFISPQVLKGPGPYFVAALPLDEHGWTFAINLTSGEYLRRGRGDYWVRMPGKTIYDHLDYYTDLAGQLSQREDGESVAMSLSYFEATEPRTYRAPIGDYSGGYMARQCNH